ncbi:MAG: hypothetical protein FJ029_02800 [Actinobacteria bacterium]|nr:hypothetical protein [Actinomycetota bacterium]
MTVNKLYYAGDGFAKSRRRRAPVVGPVASAGPGHSVAAVEVHRRSAGRLRLVVSREDGAWWLHVQPAPSLASMSRRFRESHALRVMGFAPVPACRFFPSACAFAGCYSRTITPASDGEVSEDQAGAITRHLEQAVDGLLGIAAQVEPLGWAIQPASSSQ